MNTSKPSWTWKTYLNANAKFLSPKASNGEGHIASDIKEFETLMTPENWPAMKAKHDLNLVNNFTTVMEGYMGDRTIKKKEMKHVYGLFEPLLDNYGNAYDWCENSSKADVCRSHYISHGTTLQARDMVLKGDIQAATTILREYLRLYCSLRRSKVIVPECNSSVDLALVSDKGNPVLFEIEAPIALRKLHAALTKCAEFDVDWCGQPSLPSRKILRKV